jgi:hypothetical protein
MARTESERPAEASIVAFLVESSGLPFEWGRRDCALWVADWIFRVRGIDLGAEFRGRYYSSIGCNRFLARHGGLLVLASRLFAWAGIEAIDPADARPGDAACVNGPWVTPEGGDFRHAHGSHASVFGLAVAPPRAAARVNEDEGATLGIMTRHGPGAGRVAMMAMGGLVVSAAHPILRAWRI